MTDTMRQSDAVNASGTTIADRPPDVNRAIFGFVWLAAMYGAFAALSLVILARGIFWGNGSAAIFGIRWLSVRAAMEFIRDFHGPVIAGLMGIAIAGHIQLCRAYWPRDSTFADSWAIMFFGLAFVGACHKPLEPLLFLLPVGGLISACSIGARAQNIRARGYWISAPIFFLTLFALPGGALLASRESTIYMGAVACVFFGSIVGMAVGAIIELRHPRLHAFAQPVMAHTAAHPATESLVVGEQNREAD